MTPHISRMCFNPILIWLRFCRVRRAHHLAKIGEHGAPYNSCPTHLELSKNPVGAIPCGRPRTSQPKSNREFRQHFCRQGLEIRNLFAQSVLFVLHRLQTILERSQFFDEPCTKFSLFGFAAE
jgi:hypothetical protein